MPAIGVMINLVILLMMIVMSIGFYIEKGWRGIFTAHLLCAAGWIVMGVVAILTGIWPDNEGLLSVIGLLPWAFLFNTLLLPVAILALWQRRSDRANSSDA